eukprot:394603-Rhodomonas_salina.1
MPRPSQALLTLGVYYRGWRAQLRQLSATQLTPALLGRATNLPLPAPCPGHSSLLAHVQLSNHLTTPDPPALPLSSSPTTPGLAAPDSCAHSLRLRASASSHPALLTLLPRFQDVLCPPSLFPSDPRCDHLILALRLARTSSASSLPSSLPSPPAQPCPAPRYLRAAQPLSTYRRCIAQILSTA